MPRRRKAPSRSPLPSPAAGLLPTILLAEFVALAFAAVAAGLWPPLPPADSWPGVGFPGGYWNWIAWMLTDRPAHTLGFASNFPWIHGLYLPLWPLLAVGGVLLACRARTLGLRGLGAATALAAGMVAAALALSAAGQPVTSGGARSLAGMGAFVVLVLFAGTAWLLLEPLRRATGGPAISAASAAALLLWALLSVQVIPFVFRPAEMLGQLLGIETAGIQGGFRFQPGAVAETGFAVSILVASALTALLPARIVLRGDGFLRAVRLVALVLVRRPAAFAGATLLLLLVKVPCVLATQTIWLAWAQASSPFGAYALLSAAWVTAGLFGGLAAWLTGRLGLALTEPE